MAAVTALVAVSHDVVAQNQTIVSPVSVGTGDGVGGANAFPWASGVLRRYMQIHSDIKGSPKVINKLAWRRDGAAATSTNIRSVDLEVFMGDSREYDQPSYVISNNYLGTPTNVFTRQVVNLGPCSTAGNPAPFEIALPLSAPFVYTGVNSVAWEALLYNGVAPLLPSGDIHSSFITTATVATVGTGCIASGRTTAMTLTVTGADSAGIIHFGGYVLNGPSTASTILAIGSTNPNLPVFGLCSNLYTDLLVTLPVGSTDAAGALRNFTETSNFAAPSMVFSAPNTAPGAVLYLQAHALDLGSTSLIPVANSSGVSFTFPVSNTSRLAQATRLFNNTGGTTGANAIYFNTSSIGYAQVTEFTY